MRLYNYFRSSASFRVRIALALKQLPYDYQVVHLQKGEQHQGEFAAHSADHLVPMLQLDDGAHVLQSLAICEYLDETHPTPPLLPADPMGRARVRALAQMVACDIHPINNLRVLQYLTQTLGVDEDAKNAWYAHWVTVGLEAFEQRLREPTTGAFCHGPIPTLADVCLVPQIFNAQRFEVPLAGYPRMMKIFEACMTLPAFAGAQPSACPEANA
ncbi:MAG: maleylacetoacetate isomerase [Proteobacteria bacterium]|nr:maleylacetoacetate isomerase [Pseudomonadota bacterium]